MKNTTNSTVVSPRGNRVGSVIDERYELLELIGQGGMGDVYRAEHVAIRRPVAIKLMEPELASVPDLASRFEREALVIGKISHDNCVTAFDFGRLPDGAQYLVMELLEGTALDDILEDFGRIAPIRAFKIIRHVVSGLGHIHAAGVVHRDIKPGNIVLVEHKGEPDFAKILDFGIARITGHARNKQETSFTQAGFAFGTPIYMSPEQALGEPAGPESDLYSATVMLYEMIAGHPPFQSDDRMEVLAMHINRPLSSLASVVPEPVAKELEDFLQRGMAKRAVDRFRDAAEFLAALDQVIAGVGKPSTRTRSPFKLATVPSWRETWDRVWQNKTLIFALSFLAAMVVGAGLWKWQHSVVLAPSFAGRAALLAEQSLDVGNPERAISLIQDDPAAKNDPDALVQLGHAHASQLEYTAALKAYREAIALRPSIAHDEKVKANLSLLFDHEGKVFVEAGYLLARFDADATAAGRLAILAASPDRDLRREAFAAVEKLGALDKINRVKSFTYDLEQGGNCEERKNAVGKLRALGDPAAIPVLEGALFRKAKRGKKNLNQCLVRASKDAIHYLRSVRGK